MAALGLLVHGFAVLLTWKTLVLMMVGLVLGIFVGVLPGLGGPNGVAILLPLTFTMDPTSAIVMLSCIYWGALFGGAITDPVHSRRAWSVATTFDGYPMAPAGRGGGADRGLHLLHRLPVAVLLITFPAPMIRPSPPNSARGILCGLPAHLLLLVGLGARPSTRRLSRCRSACCSPASAWTRYPASCA
jgi:hypothetical protein